MDDKYRAAAIYSLGMQSIVLIEMGRARYIKQMSQLNTLKRLLDKSMADLELKKPFIIAYWETFGKVV